MPIDALITKDTTWWNCDASLPSPSSLTASSGSSSPKSTSSSCGEFSSWPESSGYSSSSSGAGSPPVFMPSVWGPPPTLPAGFNPAIPPPMLPQQQSNSSSSLFPTPSAVSHTASMIRTNFHGGHGGFGAELERLFGCETGATTAPPPPTYHMNPSITNPSSMPLSRPELPPSPVEDTSSMPLGGFDITPKMWEDFRKNGKECDLDDLDRMIRSAGIKERKPRRLPSLEELSAYDQTDPMIQRTALLRVVSDSEGKPQPHPWVAKIKKNNNICRFCWKNGETEVIYKSHSLKDKANRITCPILYIYTCPLCGAKGHNAHTKKYCPLNTGDVQPSISALKTGRTSTGKRRLTSQQWGGASIPSSLDAYTSAAAAAAQQRLWASSLENWLSNGVNGLILKD